MDQEYLTATAAFQCLIQSTAGVIDHRDEGERHGLIADWMNQDEAIAITIARMIFQKYERKHSPAMMASVLHVYCHQDIFESFMDFYGQLSANVGMPSKRISFENIQGCDGY